MKPCKPSPSRFLQNETEFERFAGSLNQLETDPASNCRKAPCPGYCKHDDERIYIRCNGQKPACNAAWFQENKPVPSPALSQENARPVSFMETPTIEFQVIQRSFSVRLMTKIWAAWWRLTWRSSRHAPWSDD